MSEEAKKETPKKKPSSMWQRIVTGACLIAVLALVLCLGGCWWAVNHWGWPMWVYIPAILLGLAAGAQNFWVFAKEHLKRAQKDKPRRVGFNSHL